MYMKIAKKLLVALVAIVFVAGCIINFKVDKVKAVSTITVTVSGDGADEMYLASGALFFTIEDDEGIVKERYELYQTGGVYSREVNEWEDGMNFYIENYDVLYSIDVRNASAVAGEINIELGDEQYGTYYVDMKVNGEQIVVHEVTVHVKYMDDVTWGAPYFYSWAYGFDDEEGLDFPGYSMTSNPDGTWERTIKVNNTVLYMLLANSDDTWYTSDSGYGLDATCDDMYILLNADGRIIVTYDDEGFASADAFDAPSEEEGGENPSEEGGEENPSEEGGDDSSEEDGEDESNESEEDGEDESSESEEDGEDESSESEEDSEDESSESEEDGEDESSESEEDSEDESSESEEDGEDESSESEEDGEDESSESEEDGEDESEPTFEEDEDESEPSGEEDESSSKHEGNVPDNGDLDDDKVGGDVEGGDRTAMGVFVLMGGIAVISAVTVLVTKYKKVEE